MCFRFNVLVLLVFTVFSSALSALTLEEYLEDVRNNSVKIRIKENDKNKSKWENLQSYSGYLPGLSLNGAFYYSRDNESKLNAPGALADPILASVRNPMWTRNVTVSLPVFLGGKRVLGNLIAKRSKEISEIDLDLERLNTEATAVAAYFQAYIAQENIDFTKKALKAAQENMRTAKLLLEVGKTTELAYLNFELAYRQREQELKNYKLELDKNKAQMSSIASKEIEFDKLEKVDFKKVEEPFIDSEYQEVFDKNKKIMLKNSPILKKLKKYEKIAKYGELMTFSELFPMLNFTYVHDFGKAEDHPFQDTFLSNDDNVMLSLSWNLFNGFSDAIEWKKASADKISAQLTYLDTKNGQIYSLKSVVSTVYSLLEQVLIARKSVELSKKALDQSNLEYENGKALYLDLLNAENNYLQAYKSLVFLENSIFNSYYQLKLLTGTGDDK